MTLCRSGPCFTYQSHIELGTGLDFRGRRMLIEAFMFHQRSRIITTHCVLKNALNERVSKITVTVLTVFQSDSAGRFPVCQRWVRPVGCEYSAPGAGNGGSTRLTRQGVVLRLSGHVRG